MIVREIIQDPEGIIRQFDWFNDYKDTRNYLRSTAPDWVPWFDAHHLQWINRARTSRTFSEPHPDKPNVTLHGCPRFSTLANMWLIDLYEADAYCVGAIIARGDDLEWIKANPSEVKAMQARCKEWVDKTEDIPF